MDRSKLYATIAAGLDIVQMLEHSRLTIYLSIYVLISSMLLLD